MSLFQDIYDDSQQFESYNFWQVIDDDMQLFDLRNSYPSCDLTYKENTIIEPINPSIPDMHQIQGDNKNGEKIKTSTKNVEYESEAISDNGFIIQINDVVTEQTTLDRSKTSPVLLNIDEIATSNARFKNEIKNISR